MRIFLLIVVALTGCDFARGTLKIDSSDAYMPHRLSLYKSKRTLRRPWDPFFRSHEFLHVSQDHPFFIKFRDFLVSEPLSPQVFAEGMSLSAGTYLLLADCSHQIITIEKQKTHRIPLRKLLLKMPQQELGSSPGVEIFCSRGEGGFWRQRFDQVSELYVLPGNHSITVEMVPYEIQSTEDTLLLSALLVQGKKGAKHFYLSAQKRGPSITKKYPVGSWIALLPGEYEVSVHGSKKLIRLFPQGKLTLALSHFRVTTPEGVVLKNALSYMRRPYGFTLWQGESFYRLQLNRTYGILPGQYELQLDLSDSKTPLTLKPDSEQTLPLRSLSLDYRCEDFSFDDKMPACDESMDVYLYFEKEAHPIKASSHMPILFHHHRVSVQLGGSHGLRKLIRWSSQDFSLKKLALGVVVISGVKVYTKSEVTELVRVEVLDQESKNKNSLGVSEDIKGKVSTLYLIPGTYGLVSYSSLEKNGIFTQERRVMKVFTVKENKLMSLSYPYYLKEPKQPL